LYKIILYWFICCGPFAGFAQATFNYVHYDTKDGLAGSTIYSMVQDKEGFIWLATENGLSRYDGSRFKNFTVKDGLPDNEVLKVFADSRGRVWIATFNKALCYYANGKIHNSNNDTIIRKLRLSNTIQQIEENGAGSIIFCDSHTIIELTKNNEAVYVSDLPVFNTWQNDFIQVTASRDQDGFYLSRSTFLYRYTDGVIKALFETNPTIFKPNETTFRQTWEGYVTKIKMPPGTLFGKYIIETGKKTFATLMCFFTTDGCWTVDTARGQLADHFLPGIQVTDMITDVEHNTWFSTFGNGVYKMPSKTVKTLRPGKQSTLLETEIFCIEKDGAQMLAGSGLSVAYKVNEEGNLIAADYSEERKKMRMPNVYNRIVAVKRFSSGAILYGFDMFLLKEDKNKKIPIPVMPVKSVAEISNDTALIATGRAVLTMNAHTLKIIDTIWYERGTKAIFHNNHYFVGTLNGLFEIGRDKKAVFLGNLSPALSRRITDIREAGDGSLWIATGDEGIVGLRDGRVMRTIKDSNGLSSNICRTLFITPGFLWAGTNKGINKISLTDNGSPIIKYSVSDGLPSDAINALYVQDSIVWVGSPSGLTFFNEKEISNASICRLKLMNISVSGIPQSQDLSCRIPFSNNNINFEYTAISHKSGGDIIYYYRLRGLNANWITTAQTSLTYQSLDPGDYTLELYAVNKFGVRSETLSLPFSIVAPFWRTWWFYTAAGLGLLLCTVFLLNLRNKSLRRKLEEKNRLQKQFAALEQQALQSQMNPHFIFNCLNAIQQYILTNDKEKANKYLTGFASLMRQTLDNSGRKAITVADEVRYLRQYLEMERLRFGDSFTYNITVSNTVRQDYTEIPAMLLQPFVENCLRHGIRYKTDNSGRIDIAFFTEAEYLCCSIRDNGVGREKTAALKSLQHIEYQSKGMSLTQQRVALLNKMTDEVITTDIIDHKDADGNATGTEVIVKIPL
jgi:hypothetical protein